MSKSERLEIQDKFIYAGPKRHKPKYSDDFIKSMPDYFSEQFKKENEKAEEYERMNSILLKPREDNNEGF